MTRKPGDDRKQFQYLVVISREADPSSHPDYKVIDLHHAADLIRDTEIQHEAYRTLKLKLPTGGFPIPLHILLVEREKNKALAKLLDNLHSKWSHPNLHSVLPVSCHSDIVMASAGSKRPSLPLIAVDRRPAIILDNEEPQKAEEVEEELRREIAYGKQRVAYISERLEKWRRASTGFTYIASPTSIPTPLLGGPSIHTDESEDGTGHSPTTPHHTVPLPDVNSSTSGSKRDLSASQAAKQLMEEAQKPGGEEERRDLRYRRYMIHTICGGYGMPGLEEYGSIRTLPNTEDGAEV